MRPRWYTKSNTMRMTQLQPPRWPVVLFLLWLGALGVASTLAAQTPPDSQGQQTLQHAIIEGLAAGRDVSDLLQTLRRQPVPLARPPLPPRPTTAADLQAQLLAFRQVLEQTTPGLGRGLSPIIFRARLSASTGGPHADAGAFPRCRTTAQRGCSAGAL